jgi:hypothetical protein
MCITNRAESTGCLNGGQTAWWPRPDRFEPHRDHLFVHMLHAFRDTGGIAREVELARRAKRRIRPAADGARDQPPGLISFEWHAWVWLPMFQFADAHSLSLRLECEAVVAELAPFFDGWRLALWFAEANAWLDDRCPVHMLESHPNDVYDAARADRFVVAG